MIDRSIHRDLQAHFCTQTFIVAFQKYGPENGQVICFSNAVWYLAACSKLEQLNYYKIFIWQYPGAEATTELLSTNTEHPENVVQGAKQHKHTWRERGDNTLSAITTTIDLPCCPADQQRSSCSPWHHTWRLLKDLLCKLLYKVLACEQRTKVMEKRKWSASAGWEIVEQRHK